MKTPESDAIELIRRALVGLRFGEIVIAVHDGQIVQISRTEKMRPRADSSSRGSHS